LAAATNGAGTNAAFNVPHGICNDVDNNVFVADVFNQIIRKVTPLLIVTTLAGSGVAGFSDGLGIAAMFNCPKAVAVDMNGNIIVADQTNHRIRLISSGANVVTLAGNGSPSYVDGIGTSASFHYPVGVTCSSRTNVIYVVDAGNSRIRSISPGGYVSTLAGNGVVAAIDGIGTAAAYNFGGLGPWTSGIIWGKNDILYIPDASNKLRLLILSSNVTTTFSGSGAATLTNGFGTAASYKYPNSIALDQCGNMYVTDGNNHCIRQLTCVPCPSSYYCFSGAPVLCPAGSFCPLSSINATLCPKGSYSNAGAANCTLCSSGTFASKTGSTSCQQCPGGHFCPAGTSSWARLNCGRGNYCPDGSGTPTPCPYQVPPTGGWGALQVQGPAFLVETSHCLNHCFWNFTSGDGMLSKC
jgi:sugar lactone lactonase YvrE